MRPQTRRDFLMRSAATASLSLAPWRAFGQAAEGPPQLSIARWKVPEQQVDEELSRAAVRLTETAIGNLGGMARFVKRGDIVWIKPSLGFERGPQYATNTNPDVVATLVRLCLDAGAKQVKVGDNSCYSAERAYPLSGIEAAARAAGAEVVYVKRDRIKTMRLDGERLKEWPICTDIYESDLVISVPIAKHHAMTAVSLCMKNYMGVIGGPRPTLHTDMPTCLTDIAAFFKPQISVLDAVRVLTRNGPLGYSLSDTKVMGTVAAGTDVVGLEAFGAELMGCDPSQGKTIAKAQARGLGNMDYRQLSVRDEEIV